MKSRQPSGRAGGSHWNGGVSSSCLQGSKKGAASGLRNSRSRAARCCAPAKSPRSASAFAQAIMSRVSSRLWVAPAKAGQASAGCCAVVAALVVGTGVGMCLAPRIPMEVARHALLVVAAFGGLALILGNA